jgi:DNA-binding beta-propeller fold protein YncE
MQRSYLAIALCLCSATGIAATVMPQPIAELPMLARVTVPAGPGWLGVGFGSVWLTKSESRTLFRIDPASDQVTASIPVGPDAELGIAFGLGAVWVADTKDHRLRQIDPRSNKVVNTFPVNIADEPEGSIAVGTGSLWLLTNENGTDSGTLSRMNPKTGKVIANIRVKPHSYAVVVAHDSAWVSNSGDASVLRIDTRTNKVTADIAVRIWVLSQSDGSLARIDPVSNRVIATIELGGAGPGGDLAVEDGMVWASAEGVPVSMIDPKTNTLVRQFAGGQKADTLRAGFGAVWVVDEVQGQIWKLSISQLRQGH